MELEIRLNFGKTSEFYGVWTPNPHPPSVRHCPCLGGYRPQIPALSAFYPQLNLLNPPKNNPGVTPRTPKQNSWVRHWLEIILLVL
jgi:hypothetical protein